jgi:hypothetical protein
MPFRFPLQTVAIGERRATTPDAASAPVIDVGPSPTSARTSSALA